MVTMQWMTIPNSTTLSERIILCFPGHVDEDHVYHFISNSTIKITLIL